jgi:hypothetical protein
MQADDNAPRERLTARFARGAERNRWRQQRLPLGAYQALARVRAAVDAGTGEGVTPQDVQDALRLLPGLREELDCAERRLIEAARDRGASWAALAAPLGVRSRQAAEQRYRRLAGGELTGPDPIRDPGLARRERARQREAGTDLGASPAARIPARARPGKAPDAAASAPGADATGGAVAYQLRRASDYATTGAWTVLVDGEPVGSVRPVYGATGRPKAWQARYGIWPAGVRGAYPTRDAAAVQVLAERQRRPAAGRRSSTKR